MLQLRQDDLPEKKNIIIIFDITMQNIKTFKHNPL